MGVLKGVIFSIHPKAEVLDLCHGVEPQNVLHGAILLENAYSFFPHGSIFVCVVDPGVGTLRKIIAARSEHYWFLGPDNGILSLALKRERKVTVRQLGRRDFFLTKEPSTTFHGRDIMAPAAAHLASGKEGRRFEQIGPLVRHYRVLELPKVKQSFRSLEGVILYFDHFGNAITNILREHKPESFWKRARVLVGKKPLGPLQKNYASAPSRLMGVINSFSHLEIAFPHGSAKTRGRLKVGQRVCAVQA